MNEVYGSTPRNEHCDMLEGGIGRHTKLRLYPRGSLNGVLRVGLIPHLQLWFGIGQSKCR